MGDAFQLPVNGVSLAEARTAIERLRGVAFAIGTMRHISLLVVSIAATLGGWQTSAAADAPDFRPAFDKSDYKNDCPTKDGGRSVLKTDRIVIPQLVE